MARGDGAGRARSRRVPLAGEAKERTASRPHADLPRDRIRRLALGPHAPGVDAAKMVPRAERDPVLALVATAAGAEDEMVVVELLSRRADGDGAAPAIAGEDRIAMARLPLPFGLDVQEKRFEPADERVAGVGEGEDRGTEERHDG